MVNKPLINPYFWGGYVRGGWLTSHDISIHTGFHPPLKTTRDPKTNSQIPWKWMVGIRGRFLLGFGLFSGAIAVRFRECNIFPVNCRVGGNSKIFLFSTLILGEMIQIWRAYFSNGLKPPPSCWLEDEISLWNGLFAEAFLLFFGGTFFCPFQVIHALWFVEPYPSADVKLSTLR